MKTISEIFRNELKTRDDITTIARSVELKQRDTKRYAINSIKLLNAATPCDDFIYCRTDNTL
jgi:hypothetical protein